MRDYDKIMSLSYLKYQDVNHLYDWVMSQNLPGTDLKWVDDVSEFDESFIKNYNEESDVQAIFLKLMFNISKKLHDLHNELPFLPERIKIEKIKNLVSNLHDKTECVIRIRNVQEALNHRLLLRKTRRVTKSYQKAWLNACIDMNTELRKKTKK